MSDRCDFKGCDNIFVKIKAVTGSISTLGDGEKGVTCNFYLCSDHDKFIENGCMYRFITGIECAPVRPETLNCKAERGYGA